MESFHEEIHDYLQSILRNKINGYKINTWRKRRKKKSLHIINYNLIITHAKELQKDTGESLLDARIKNKILKLYLITVGVSHIFVLILEDEI